MHACVCVWQKRGGRNYWLPFDFREATKKRTHLLIRASRDIQRVPNQTTMYPGEVRDKVGSHLPLSIPTNINLGFQRAVEVSIFSSNRFAYCSGFMASSPILGRGGKKELTMMYVLYAGVLLTKFPCCFGQLHWPRMRLMRVTSPGGFTVTSSRLGFGVAGQGWGEVCLTIQTLTPFLREAQR